MKKIRSHNLENFMEYGINADDRVIYSGSYAYDEEGGESGVDFLVADRMIKSLILLDLAAPEGNKPITIILNTPGGHIAHGMAIYDAIKTCKNKVDIIVNGMAESMGAVILQAADKRLVSENSTVMIHYGTAGIVDHPKITQKWAEQFKKQDKILEQLLLNKIREKHPDFKLSKLKRMLDFDTILSAQEAVDLGLADEVLGVKQ